jgi:hypothetical protein
LLLDPRLKRGAECRARRLLGITDGQQLEVPAAERQDLIMGSEPFVTTASDGGDSQLVRESRGCAVEIASGVDHVVDAHTAEHAIRGE